LARVGSFEPLTSDDIGRIGQASLEVLEGIGVKFHEPRIVELLSSAGAEVVDDKLVRIPSSLIKEMIKKAPSRFVWHGREPGREAVMGSGKVHYAGAHTLLYTIDLETGERRDATLKDAQDLTRLLDYLEHVHIGYCMVHPRDVPDSAAHAYVMLAMAENTTKPFFGRMFGTATAKDCVEMAAIMAGGREMLAKRPNLLGIVNPVSPLQFDRMQLQGLIEYVSAGLPIAICPEVQSGVTGPATIAGTLTQLNAEALAGITVIQLLNPGCPALYGSVSSILDMRTASIRLGSIETGILAAAAAQMAHSYGLPCRIVAGATDSKVLDMQAGYESALNLFIATMAGGDLVTYAVGGIEHTLTASYEKVLIDHEIIESIQRGLRGFEINENTLAIEVMKRLGPGGFYLAERHTRDNFRKEHLLTKLADTQNYDLWKKSGGKNITQRANEEVRKILSNHHPKPLDKDIRSQLQAYLEKVVKSCTK